MSGYAKTILLLLVTVLLVAPSALSVQRVAARLNTVEFFGGYSDQFGQYDGTIVSEFIDDNGRHWDIDAANVYDPGFHLGFSYGTVRGRHWLMSVGFCYINHKFEDTAVVPDGSLGFYLPETPTFEQYDLNLNLNYLLHDLRSKLWSPYLGLGVSAGVSGAKFDLFENEYKTTLSLGLNFGADFKIWSDKASGAFVTLSSINSWDFLTSNDRPRYLHLGGGIKYYFRP